MAEIPDITTKFNITIERCIFFAKRSRDYYNLTYECGSYKLIFPRVFEYVFKNRIKKDINQFCVGDIELMKKKLRFYELIDTSNQKKIWYSNRAGIKFEQVVGSDLVLVSKVNNQFDNFTCNIKQLEYIRTNHMKLEQYNELKEKCVPGKKDFLINETVHTGFNI